MANYSNAVQYGTEEVITIHFGNDIKYKKYTIVERLTRPCAKPVCDAIKRVFDIILSLFGTLIALLPMIFITILIKLDSPGPAFFIQERLGKDGKPFHIIKFRSMRIDAEKNGAQWACLHDTRVTKIGKTLRSTRLDELPQLFCILIGKMSFVGPRPERAVFYDEFDKYIEGFRQRLLVKPGLTGLAQINGGYELEPEEKIIYDIEYIKTRSPYLDFKIILKTIIIVFNHNGAR